MSQQEFEMIVHCIKRGVPAYADELIKSFVRVVDTAVAAMKEKADAENKEGN